jgi:CDP-diacylglycerol--glycerol-3-phosphate 3-phosphatidyltransferase
LLRDFIITFLRIYADRKGLVFTTSYYAQWKTLLQMVFLYYLLIIYVGSVTPELNTKFDNVFQLLLDPELLYFILLLITIITVHSGLFYINKNKEVIRKIFSW